MKNRTTEYLRISDEELQTRLEAAQDELAGLGFQLATKKVTNYARLKVLRKDIARLLFFIEDRNKRAVYDAI